MFQSESRPKCLWTADHFFCVLINLDLLVPLVFVLSSLHRFASLLPRISTTLCRRHFQLASRQMFSVFVNALSTTIPLDISPTTTIGEMKQSISRTHNIAVRNFDLSIHGHALTDVSMMADACGITRDSFITVLEKPLNQVRF